MSRQLVSCGLQVRDSGVDLLDRESGVRVVEADPGVVEHCELDGFCCVGEVAVGGAGVLVCCGVPLCFHKSKVRQARGKRKHYPQQNIPDKGLTPVSRVRYLGHMSEPDQITTREAADMLGLSIRTTIRRVESGELTPARKLPGLRGPYIFDRNTIEEYRHTK